MIGSHNNLRTGQFKELNSQLNREVAEFETTRTAGTHTLNEVFEEYEPSSELEAEARAQVLGGSDAAASNPHESPEQRRQRVLGATMARLSVKDKQVEDSCGTSRPPPNS